MELKWLEDFVAVARLQNFSSAARTRYATQPALSRRVKALENWYGVALIDRSRYPVVLTAAGEQFLDVAERVIGELYGSRSQARGSMSAADRTVRFVMPHSLAGAFFPGWWVDQEQEEVTTMIATANFDECVELLRSGASQLLICWRSVGVADDLERHGIRCIRIGHDRLVPVAGCDSGGHPLHSLDAVAGQRIPILGYRKTSFLGRVTRNLYDRLDIERRTTLHFEAELVEPLKAVALLGEGIAWLPELTIARELQSGLLKIVGDDSTVEPLSIELCRIALQEGDPDSTVERIWKNAASRVDELDGCSNRER
ncbi:LysR family transcriptional regulator [Burkholderia sp. Bp8986]|uniref:LysR family transcriptional regulator n=1 Tax=Burkholderia sp. Bp8986 TaxID=2184550 RepID=UPI00163A1B38|nr:LysR family transcriptional regulator [Burkholderia sp. Bp8986]